MLDVQLDSEGRDLIRERMQSEGLSQAELARRVGVHRSVINKILSGEQDGASRETLAGIADELDIPPNRLRVQLELEIDDKFIRAAERALKQELLRLQKDVGRVRAVRVTGSIGVHFHARDPQKRVVERVFAIPE